MTTVDQFYRAVANMRTAQRRYFLTNSAKWKHISKAREAEVDAAIEAFVGQQRIALPFEAHCFKFQIND